MKIFQQLNRYFTSQVFGYLLMAINLLIGLAFLIYGLYLPWAKVEISWETRTEIDTMGYNIYRSELDSSGEISQPQKITETMILAQGSETRGAKYSYLDKDVQAGTKYFYELEDIETTGKVTRRQLSSTVPSGQEKWLVLGSSLILLLSAIGLSRLLVVRKQVVDVPIE